jgi:hypothetical protein
MLLSSAISFACASGSLLTVVLCAPLDGSPQSKDDGIIAVVKAHPLNVCCVRLSDDGAVLVTAGWDHVIKWWQIKDRKVTEVARKPSGEFVVYEMALEARTNCVACPIPDREHI